MPMLPSRGGTASPYGSGSRPTTLTGVGRVGRWDKERHGIATASRPRPTTPTSGWDRWDGGTVRIHAAHRPTCPTRSGAARSSWRFTARSALPVRSRQARDTAAVGSPRASDITSTRGPRYLPSRKLDHPSSTMQARWTAPGQRKSGPARRPRRTVSQAPATPVQRNFAALNARRGAVQPAPPLLHRLAMVSLLRAPRPTRPANTPRHGLALKSAHCDSGCSEAAPLSPAADASFPG